MRGSRAFVAALFAAALCGSTALAQAPLVNVLWTGLFGPYARHPPPGDPLPDVTLFPLGEIPRPLTRTDQVPGKVGTRFGLLFSLHTGQERAIEVRHVIHYPSPARVHPGEPPAEVSDDAILCIEDRPCYAGYFFEREEEVLPGKWRMEVLVNGVKVHEATFIVVRADEREI